jgi:hypothetical protein
MADATRPTAAQAAELRAVAGIGAFPDYRPDPAARAECKAAGQITPDGTLTDDGHAAMRTFAERYGVSQTDHNRTTA